MLNYNSLAKITINNHVIYLYFSFLYYVLPFQLKLYRLNKLQFHEINNQEPVA